MRKNDHKTFSAPTGQLGQCSLCLQESRERFEPKWISTALQERSQAEPRRVALHTIRMNCCDSNTNYSRRHNKRSEIQSSIHHYQRYCFCGFFHDTQQLHHWPHQQSYFTLSRVSTEMGRQRPHDRQLSIITGQLRNRNFINRMLFKDCY